MKVKKISVNRILACMTAIFVFALSMNFSSMDTNAGSTSRTYKIFNATTGAYIDKYTLVTDSSNNNPRTIIGNDDRVVDFTKSGVVKIMDADDYIGSGFVVGVHTIATASHCVYDIEEKKPYKISEIRLFDANGNISKTVTPIESHVTQKYIEDAQDSVNYDYGLITVKEDLSDYACFDLGVTLDSAINNNSAISVTGFPRYFNNEYDNPVNTHTLNKMYTGNGVLENKGNFSGIMRGLPKTFYADSTLFYTADSSGGNSGGPAYITTSYKNRVYYTVIGIHNHSLPGMNSATRITPDLLHFYMNNPNV